MITTVLTGTYCEIVTLLIFDEIFSKKRLITISVKRVFVYLFRWSSSANPPLDRSKMLGFSVGMYTSPVQIY
jgi:hypothetical protein